MKKYILSWALPAILLAGCTQESVTDETLDKGQDLIFETLSSKNSGTRTTVDAGGLVTWSASDEIRVNGISSSKTTLLDGGSAAQFMVSGVTGTNFYALYPSTMYAYHGDGTYGLNLPATQIYKDNVTFSDNANPSVAYSSSSSSGDAYKLAFYNLCGIMKVNIKAASGPISGIRYVRLTTNEDIAGSFNADCQTNVLSAGTGDKYKTIDMDLGTDKSTDDNITVYFVLPPNTYSAGFKLFLLDVDKNTLSESMPSAKEMRIVRSKRSSVTVHMGASASTTVPEIKTSSFKPGTSQQSSPTASDIACMLAHGVYWDTAGPAWRLPTTVDYASGLWIRTKMLDSSLSALRVTCQPATAAIRLNPNYIFLPAAGFAYPGNSPHLNHPEYGHYGCSSDFISGVMQVLHFRKAYASVGRELYNIWVLPWNSNGPILE